MQPLWKLCVGFLEAKIELPYDPSTPFLGIFPKASIAFYQETWISMFTAALFIIAMAQNQFRCPLTDAWKMKIWYIYTIEFYPAVNKTEIMKLARKWMELEYIILSAVTQAQKVYILSGM